MKNLTLLLRDNYLKSGVSISFIVLSDLKNNYTQLYIALNIGGRYKAYQCTYYFEDIAIYYLIECCTKEFPSYLVSSNKILTLLNYDQQHDSSYFTTLKIYIENNINAVKSSKELFIHRRTFPYIIEKIKTLINIDFDNKQSVLYCALSFKILELFNFYRANT